MDDLRKKIILIFSVTWNILRYPFGFGRQITDDASETRRAGRYLFEAGIFAFAIYQFALKRIGVESFLAELPFAGEIFAAFLLASVLLTGLTTHYVGKLFSSKQPSIHASLSCFFYWSGFSFFVMLPVVGLVIFALQWGAGAFGIAPAIMAALTASILILLIAIYFVGTISSWIGSAYGMTPLMSGFVILLSYTLASLVSFAVLAFKNSVMV